MELKSIRDLIPGRVWVNGILLQDVHDWVLDIEREMTVRGYDGYGSGPVQVPTGRTMVSSEISTIDQFSFELSVEASEWPIVIAHGDFGWDYVYITGIIPFEVNVSQEPIGNLQWLGPQILYRFYVSGRGLMKQMAKDEWLRFLAERKWSDAAGPVPMKMIEGG